MKKWFSIFIALLPFLYQYKSPVNGISFGEFILLPFIAYFGLLEIRKNRISNMYFCGLYAYLISALFVSLFSCFQIYFSFGNFITVAVRILYYAVLTYVAIKHADLCKLLRTIEVAAIIFSAYALVQYFMHLSLGVILPTVINKSLVFAPEAGFRLDYENYYRWLYRPSSLFIEASYFASYVSVGLASFLFDKNTTKRTLMGLFITIALVAGASSAGFVLFILMWSVYVYCNILNSSESKAKKYLFVAGVLVSIVFILTSDLAAGLLDRTVSGASFNNRIVRTFLLLKSMNPFQLLFGVGINNVDNYVRYNGLYTVFDEDNLNYVSSVMGTLLCSGIITFILYLRFYFKAFFFQKNNLSRSLVLLLFFNSLIGNTSYSYSFFFVAIIILLANKRSYEERKLR